MEFSDVFLKLYSFIFCVCQNDFIFGASCIMYSMLEWRKIMFFCYAETE